MVAKTALLTFVYQKGCFQYKIEEVNTTIEFCMFELVLVPNFSLNWKFWIFRPNMPKKGVSGLEQKKIEQRHWILHIRIVMIPNFNLNSQLCFVFFDQICPKREFSVENGKIALVRGSMVVTYYIKLFCTRADWHNGILMSVLLLVADTITICCFDKINSIVIPTYIEPFSNKALLILWMSAFFAKNQHLLVKVIPLPSTILWELC